MKLLPELSQYFWAALFPTSLTISKQLICWTLRKLYQTLHMIFINKTLTETEPVHTLTLEISLNSERQDLLKTPHLSCLQSLPPSPMKLIEWLFDWTMVRHFRVLWLIFILKHRTFDLMEMDMVLNGQYKLKEEDFMSIKSSVKF